MNIMFIDTLIADDQVALAFASCHKLKRLRIHWGSRCEFGAFNGINGVKAMVAGCPLLEEVTLHMTVEGLCCLVGEQGCTNLKMAAIRINTPVLNIFLKEAEAGTAFSFRYPHVELIPFRCRIDGIDGTYEEDDEILPPHEEEDEGDANEEGNDNEIGVDVP